MGTSWRNLTFVKVETDEGLTGVSEVRMNNRTDALVAYIDGAKRGMFSEVIHSTQKTFINACSATTMVVPVKSSQPVLALLRSHAGILSAKHSTNLSTACLVAHVVIRLKRMPTVGIALNVHPKSFMLPLKGCLKKVIVRSSSIRSVRVIMNSLMKRN